MDVGPATKPRIAQPVVATSQCDGEDTSTVGEVALVGGATHWHWERRGRGVSLQQR
jgi:hypothetical protein